MPSFQCQTYRHLWALTFSCLVFHKANPASIDHQDWPKQTPRTMYRTQGNGFCLQTSVTTSTPFAGKVRDDKCEGPLAWTGLQGITWGTNVRHPLVLLSLQWERKGLNQISRLAYGCFWRCPHAAWKPSGCSIAPIPAWSPSFHRQPCTSLPTAALLSQTLPFYFSVTWGWRDHPFAFC